MKNNSKILSSIIIRYSLIIILGLFNLQFFYLIFRPLTVYGSYYLLTLFTTPLLIGNTILLLGQGFEIINACVIGAAYYLLFILFMGIQKIDLKKRLSLILCSFATLYVFNVLRIIFLITIFKSPHFEVIHWIFWNIISTAFVIIVFIGFIKIFNVSEIPFANDLKFLYKSSNGAKKKKS
jgi:exosortase/archaeosortase family protein